jgi:hypothetical protein
LKVNVGSVFEVKEQTHAKTENTKTAKKFSEG